MWAKTKSWWFKWIWRPADPDRGYNEIERGALNSIRQILREKGWTKKQIEEHILYVKHYVLLDHRQRKFLMKRIKNQKKLP